MLVVLLQIEVFYVADRRLGIWHKVTDRVDMNYKPPHLSARRLTSLAPMQYIICTIQIIMQDRS